MKLPKELVILPEESLDAIPHYFVGPYYSFVDALKDKHHTNQRGEFFPSSQYIVVARKSVFYRKTCLLKEVL